MTVDLTISELWKPFLFYLIHITPLFGLRRIQLNGIIPSPILGSSPYPELTLFSGAHLVARRPSWRETKKPTYCVHRVVGRGPVGAPWTLMVRKPMQGPQMIISGKMVPTHRPRCALPSNFDPWSTSFLPGLLMARCAMYGIFGHLPHRKATFRSEVAWFWVDSSSHLRQSHWQSLVNLERLKYLWTILDCLLKNHT